MDKRRIVVPSPQLAGDIPAVGFPGFSAPLQDVQAVRDDRRSKPLTYTVDLSTARSFAAGTALILQLQGNVFYADPLYDLSGNSVAGIARVHFQDVNINPTGGFFTVQPQFICRLPFTQLAIENYAQAGKYLQITYGWDLDLEPGLSALVQISGTVNSALQPYSYQAAYASITNLAANTPTTIFGPGANLNGATVWDAEFWTGGAGFINAAFLAKTSAPASVIDGDPIAISTTSSGNAATAGYQSGRIMRPVSIAAGKGLYFIAATAETSAHRKVLYTLL